MKKIPQLKQIPLLVMLSVVAPAQASLFDWLYFPMYPRDNTHAVHLSVLKPQSNGLLFSASRYPGHPDDPWTEEEERLGWYNYEERLIDCQTGFAITLNEQLLDADSKEIARREDRLKYLEEWKANFPERMNGHSWPDNSEYFLACASVGDLFLKQKRQKLLLKKAAEIEFSPVIQTLKGDTNLISKKRFVRYDLAAVKKTRPATVTALFEAMKNQYRRWEKAFQPESAASSNVTPLYFNDISDALKTWLSKQDSARWLSSPGSNVAAISSRSDGTVMFTKLDPQSIDMQGVVPDRPPKAQHAEKAQLVIRADCRSGLYLPLQLDWLDQDNKILAKQPIKVNSLLQGLIDQQYFEREFERNILAPAETDAEVQVVCMAAAAQCRGLDLFLDTSEFQVQAVSKAQTAEAALLALRKELHSQVENTIPNCDIGGKSP